MPPQTEIPNSLTPHKPTRPLMNANSQIRHVSLAPRVSPWHCPHLQRNCIRSSYMPIKELKNAGFNRRDARTSDIFSASFLCALRVSAVSLPFLWDAAEVFRRNPLRVRHLHDKRCSSTAFELVGNAKRFSEVGQLLAPDLQRF